MEHVDAVAEVVERVFAVVVVEDELPDQRAEEAFVDVEARKEGLRVEAARRKEKKVFERKAEEVEVPVAFNSLELFEFGCD